MGYLNPILSYGCERFCADAEAAGVDGLVIVDLPRKPTCWCRRRACEQQPKDDRWRARHGQERHGILQRVWPQCLLREIA
jgi:hypothetical protein